MRPKVFDALAEAFGQSVVVGCSTSGEIAGPLVNDASLSVAVAQFAHRPRDPLPEGVTVVD